MTDLSDEDRGHIATVRQAMEDWMGPHSDPGFSAALERVLALAGEEPAEPDDGTFWWDPVHRNVHLRDDQANPGMGYPWYSTATMAGSSWGQLRTVWGRLVQLVPVTEVPEPQDFPTGRYQEVLVELLGAWEAEHRRMCGGSVRLSKCTYRDCKAYWIRLHSLGVRTTREEGA